MLDIFPRSRKPAIRDWNFPIWPLKYNLICFVINRATQNNNALLGQNKTPTSIGPNLTSYYVNLSTPLRNFWIRRTLYFYRKLTLYNDMDSPITYTQYVCISELFDNNFVVKKSWSKFLHLKIKLSTSSISPELCRFKTCTKMAL